MKIRVCLRSGRGAHTVQAFCPVLPGCSSAAPTEEEALALLRTRVRELLSKSGTPAPNTRLITIDL